MVKIKTQAKHHGTTTGYKSGCRCDSCRSAWAEYRRMYRARRKENGGEPLLDKGDPRGRPTKHLDHGNSKGMYRRCQCDLCVAYSAGYQTGVRHGKSGLDKT